jgi:hypothetical protein
MAQFTACMILQVVEEASTGSLHSFKHGQVEVRYKAAPTHTIRGAYRSFRPFSCEAVCSFISLQSL